MCVEGLGSRVCGLQSTEDPEPQTKRRSRTGILHPDPQTQTSYYQLSAPNPQQWAESNLTWYPRHRLENDPALKAKKAEKRKGAKIKEENEVRFIHASTALPIVGGRTSLVPS